MSSTSSATSRLFDLSKEVKHIYKFPYMVIWGRFLLQTRLAMHERSNLECMGFYPRPSCTAVRTRSQFPCVAWRFLRTNLKLVLHTVWTLGDLWRSKVVPENVPPSFTHYSNSEKKNQNKMYRFNSRELSECNMHIPWKLRSHAYLHFVSSEHLLDLFSCITDPVILSDIAALTTSDVTHFLLQITSRNRDRCDKTLFLFFRFVSSYFLFAFTSRLGSLACCKHHPHF